MNEGLYTVENLEHFERQGWRANRIGDRCGWMLLGALADHLRSAIWDRTPWLRDDAYGASVRAGCPGLYHLRSGRKVRVR